MTFPPQCRVGRRARALQPGTRASLEPVAPGAPLHGDGFWHTRHVSLDLCLWQASRTPQSKFAIVHHPLAAEWGCTYMQ